MTITPRRACQGKWHADRVNAKCVAGMDKAPPALLGRPVFEAVMERLGRSARAYHRILKLARTIADLHESEAVGQQHVSEAVGYRQLDRSPQS